MLFKKCLNIYKLFIRYIADIPMLYENYKEIKKKKKLMSNIEFFNNYIFNFVEYHNVEDCVKSPTFL